MPESAPSWPQFNNCRRLSSPTRMRVPQKLERSRNVWRKSSRRSRAPLPPQPPESEWTSNAASTQRALGSRRRDSDSSESSQLERASRASPRKRAPNRTPIPTRERIACSNASPAPPITEAPMSIPMPSSYAAPAPRPPPNPNADSRSNAYSYPFLENLRIADSIPAAQRSPERVTEPAAHPSALAHSHDAEKLDWDSADRETLLKAASRPRFIESSGVKIRSFLADAELFLTLCNRPRSRWAYFVLSWLGSEEAEKVRRSHVADSVADYEKFREGLTTIFGRFEFEGAFRAQLRSLKQSGAESVTAYAARTTDLCSRAYAEFATEAQLSLAVDHFIGGLADTSTREYLLRERARRPLEWMEAVRIAQASETARLSSAPLGAAAACDSSAIVGPDSSVCAPLSDSSRLVARKHLVNRVRNPITRPHHARNFGNRRDHSSKPNVREHARTPTHQQGPANQSHRAAKPVQSGAAKSNAPVCFNCGKPGHLAANCTADPKKVVRCYACGGAGHLARDCANRKAQTQSQSRVQSQSQTRAQSEYSNSKSVERNRLCGVRCLAIFFARGDRFNPRFRRARGHWLVLLDDERIAVRATSEQAA